MLSVIKDGVEYSLDDGTLCFLQGDVGWGMPPVRRIVGRGPLQHGETDRGYRLEAREGTLVLFITGQSRDDMYDKRSQLLSIFRPDASPVRVRWTTGVVRQIDGFFVGGMEMSSDDRPGFNQRLAITLRCPDPTFYDPAARAVVFSLGGGSDTLTVPLTVPLTVGASTINSLSVINYQGNWLSYPYRIRITGPIDDPVVKNETTGDVLDFTGTTIEVGDWYDIDLRYGHKTVVDSNGVNQINKLVAGHDLATWHIAANQENSVRVTGQGITQATKVTINYYDRYVGR